MNMLGKIRRLKLRDGLSICEICRRTGLARSDRCRRVAESFLHITEESWSVGGKGWISGKQCIFGREPRGIADRQTLMDIAQGTVDTDMNAESKPATRQTAC